MPHPLCRLSPIVLLLSAACAAPATGGAGPSLSWQELFDGSTLGSFAPTAFGGEGEVRVEDGRIILEQGDPLTGITWRGEPLPDCDYVIEVRAARLRGTDFFCGLTFPVGASHLSLILGGWGGALCGVSCIDGLDASDNDTRSFRGFESGREYRLRVEVRRDRLRAWVDGDALADVDLRGRALRVRAEVQPSVPFGIASFATRSAVRSIRIASLLPRGS